MLEPREDWRSPARRSSRTHRCRDRDADSGRVGANMNFDRLASSRKSRTGREARGYTRGDHTRAARQLREFVPWSARAISPFKYRYADPRKAHVFVGVSGAAARKPALIKVLGGGAENARFTDNELASCTSPRGRRHAPVDTRSFTARVPRSPGALMKFLTALSHGWNISLFHYRNHGATTGVLVGMQVPPRQAEVSARFSPIWLSLPGRVRNPLRYSSPRSLSDCRRDGRYERMGSRPG